MKTKTKFIFVTGGVLSSLGKGLAAASLGALLQTRGLSEHEAKKLMVRANLNKVARLVPDEGIRHKIDEYLKDVI